MFNGVRFRIEKTNLKTLVGTRPLAESSAFAPGIIKSTEPYCPRGGCIRRRASRPSCADRTCAGRAGRTRADRADRNCAGRCQAALEALKRGDTSWPDQLGQQQCPLWVKSGRDALKFSCPLYPRKRTLRGDTGMSALGQRATFRRATDNLSRGIMPGCGGSLSASPSGRFLPQHPALAA